MWGGSGGPPTGLAAPSSPWQLDTLRRAAPGNTVVSPVVCASPLQREPQQGVKQCRHFLACILMCRVVPGRSHAWRWVGMPSHCSVLVSCQCPSHVNVGVLSYRMHSCFSYRISALPFVSRISALPSPLYPKLPLQLHYRVLNMPEDTSTWHGMAWDATNELSLLWTLRETPDNQPQEGCDITDKLWS